MKHRILVITLLTIVSLAACAIPPNTSTTINTPAVSLATRTISATTPAQITLNNATEETEIRGLVGSFGKRLQTISLLAPNAAQAMQKQYSEFVSPALLEKWLNDITQAPGRRVSSPWPDRIEITTLSQAGSDRYEITGFVVEISSTEVGTSKAAAKVPVRMVIERGQAGWLIADYTEER